VKGIRRRRKPKDRERRRRQEAEPDEGSEEEEAEEGEQKAASSPSKKKRRYMPLTSPHKLAVKKTEVEAVVLSGPQKAKSVLAKVREEKRKAVEAKKAWWP
jgi:hypothetical protein